MYAHICVCMHVWCYTRFDHLSPIPVLFHPCPLFHPSCITPLSLWSETAVAAPPTTAVAERSSCSTSCSSCSASSHLASYLLLTPALVVAPQLSQPDGNRT